MCAWHMVEHSWYFMIVITQSHLYGTNKPSGYYRKKSRLLECDPDELDSELLGVQNNNYITIPAYLTFQTMKC